ncbi:hypothetical protein [Streptomyces barringtoniae]|uniref:hypothetical protein n=1 Tax=Streptomyces barringtoniae TaxID=2892029 RepID=UPI001E54CF41|nr:hypothetical protein [Streptomyces barringtoniae]MCC5474897.1 hypothetical protein [Streptomyces barringtoniae]
MAAQEGTSGGYCRRRGGRLADGAFHSAMFAMPTLALASTLICFVGFKARLVQGLATTGMKG